MAYGAFNLQTRRRIVGLAGQRTVCVLQLRNCKSASSTNILLPVNKLYTALSVSYDLIPHAIQNNINNLISNINRVTHRATHGHKLVPMPDPRLIGLPMGHAHGRTSRPIPYPFGSGAHGRTYPWVKLPA
jgi:hypothetical protein